MCLDALNNQGLIAVLIVIQANSLPAAHVAKHYDLRGARAAHGGLPLAGRFPREARLALWNATHGKLQDMGELAIQFGSLEELNGLIEKLRG